MLPVRLASRSNQPAAFVTSCLLLPWKRDDVTGPEARRHFVAARAMIDHHHNIYVSHLRTIALNSLTIIKSAKCKEYLAV